MGGDRVLVSMSPTRMTGWLRCPAREEHRSSAGRERGDPPVHLVFGEHVDAAVRGDDPPEIPARVVWDGTTPPGALRRQVEMLAPEIRSYMPARMEWQRPVSGSLAAGDVEFSFSGFIDGLDGEGNIYEIKTSTNPRKASASAWMQVGAYCWMLREEGVEPGTATVITGRRSSKAFIDGEEAVTAECLDSSSLIEAFLDQARLVARSMEGPAPIPGEHCYSCDNLDCPFNSSMAW